MGLTLSLLAKKVEQAGGSQRVIAVSRFTDPFAVKLLKENGVETISANLMDNEALDARRKQIILYTWQADGTDGQESLTWAMNVWLSVMVAQKFRNSNIVVFSSEISIQWCPFIQAGQMKRFPLPNGEYAMSCLGRERVLNMLPGMEHSCLCLSLELCN